MRIYRQEMDGTEHPLDKVPGACSSYQLQLLPTASSCPHRCTTRTSPWPEKQEVFSAEISSLGQEERIYFQPPISTRWSK
jgi:hypothetical protein